MTKANDNTRHWDVLGKTDPKHTKDFSRAGGFKGTALKPMWIIKKLTEHFGPIGEGWGMNEPLFEVQHINNDTGKVLVYCKVQCWHTDKANTFWGVGGDSVQDQFRNGNFFADDEAYKKAFTDAVNNAFKFVGVGADIHMGQFEDSKYVREVAKEFAETPAYMAGLEGFILAVPKCTTLEQLDACVAEYKQDLDAAKAAKDPKRKAAMQAYSKRKQEIAPDDEKKEAA